MKKTDLNFEEVDYTNEWDNIDYSDVWKDIDFSDVWKDIDFTDAWDTGTNRGFVPLSQNDK